MKRQWRRYSHAWILSYFFIYIIWFFCINQMSADSFHPIEMSVDSLIPFNEWFILPYYIWFAYIPLGIGYFFFTSREEFYRLCMFLFIGMTICLVFYTMYPTGIYFRPDLDSLGRDNILIDMTRFIYQVDTGTNVCPSIHCFNSIGIAIAMLKCRRLNKLKWHNIGVVSLSLLICLSTMFVKQHSVIDVFYAIALSCIMYVVAYVPRYDFLFRKDRITKKHKVRKESYVSNHSSL